MGLTNPGRSLGRSCLLLISWKLSTLSVRHYALFHKLISAGLSPCFARWTQYFLSDRHACMVYQNHKSRSFRVRRGVPQGSVLGPVLFSLFINDFPAFLPSPISCSFYAHDLAIWSSSPSFPTAAEATLGALFRLVRWSEYWCLRNFERNKNLAVCLLIHATVTILNRLCHILIEFKNSAHII